jgi:hypothetical protein
MLYEEKSNSPACTLRVVVAGARQHGQAGVIAAADRRVFLRGHAHMPLLVGVECRGRKAEEVRRLAG